MPLAAHLGRVVVRGAEGVGASLVVVEEKLRLNPAPGPSEAYEFRMEGASDRVANADAHKVRGRGCPKTVARAEQR